MKYVVIFLISLYQIIISPLLHGVFGIRYACRYPLSCSDFTKQKIKEKGVFLGCFLGFKRFLSCHPFAKHV